jgi:hypothetical protein
MKTKNNISESGNVLICVLATILILSLVGANVLQSSATRLNESTNQVRGWKEALSAAETGGDIAFAEIKKYISDPTNQWPAATWTNTGVVTGFASGTKHVLNPAVTFGNSNLMAQTTVDAFYFDTTAGNTLRLVDSTHLPPGNAWYRIRSKGTAPLPDLKRTGVDDGIVNDGRQHFATIGSTQMQDITARGKGNNLLRKIDFNYDHFVASYGPEGDGLNKALVPPSAAPSISRRIEQIVSPLTPFFDAAIKTIGSFYGLGSASYIDSYNSNNGPYDPTVKDNPSSPYYGDSRHGNVEIGSATATVKGSIYGDVATDGGNVRSGSPGIVYGTIDNNVPMTIDPFVMPSIAGWNRIMTPTDVTSNTTITPTAGGTSTAPNYYLVSSITRALTLLPAPGAVPGTTVDTYVTIRVTGDISGNNAAITVSPKVHARIYFDGNIDIKAVNLVNISPNTPAYPASGPFAGNLQFYGISPTTGGRSQTINLDSGGGQPLLAATFYAPSANVTFNGAPDFIGTVTAKTFYANGNITWHYDRALNDIGDVGDFKIISYVEDTR